MLTESIHTSKRINEFVNVYFQFFILYLLYDKLYEVDDEKLPSYQIAVIIIFLTTLSPFSISLPSCVCLSLTREGAGATRD